jgi:hypothetical protein
MIRELHGDDCGGGSEIISIRDPSWQDVIQAIHRLDGDRFTEVNLADTDSTGLVISGGAGRYLCERMQLENNYLLLDPSKPEELLVRIMRDGDEYPGNWTVDLEMVVKAARTFFETGEIDTSLTWLGS